MVEENYIQMKDGYRPTVPAEHAEAFCAAARLAAKEVPESLGYIGLVGKVRHGHASSAPHDCDLLIFPAEEAPLGKAISAMEHYCRTVDQILQRDAALYIATAGRKMQQAERYFIIGQTRGRRNLVPTHTIFFADERSLVSACSDAFMGTVRTDSETLLGDINVIDRLPNMNPVSEDAYATLMQYQLSLTSDRMPPELALERAQEVTDWIEKIWDIHVPRANTPAEAVALTEILAAEIDRKFA